MHRSGRSRIALAVAVAAVPASVVVVARPVSAANGLTMLGADVSTAQRALDLGARYYDANGAAGDPLDILKGAGVNYVRLRIWNNPVSGYNNKAKVLAYARTVKAKDLKLLVDFHYSDTWADPGHQAKPAAWAGHGIGQLQTDVYNYTYDVCTSLKAQGTTPDSVQIGNEINTGLLWDDGKVVNNDFTNLSLLLKAGYNATKACNGGTQVVIHTADADSDAHARWFYDGIRAKGVEWDITGLSYYCYWHGTLSNMASVVADVKSRYGRPVILAETAYPFTTANADSTPNTISSAEPCSGYPATPAGQAANFTAVQNTARNAGAIGVFYWEPTWYAVPGNGWDPANINGSGDGWDNQATFDRTGHLNPNIRWSAGTATASSPAAARVYYVAPNGDDGAAGTQAAPWASIAHAQSVVAAGDTVYFRGGTYAYTRGINTCASQTDTVNAITLNKSGSAGSLIHYWAYPGERPVFNFSHVTDDCRVKGFNVTGSWIHLKGLEVTGVPQNNSLNHESWGIWISGSDNIFEQINAHHNMGPGLFIQDGGGNLVLNSDSHDNYDPHSSDGAGENADGFGAHIKANHPGNVFRGCRAWWNSDDGFDLINAFSSVTIENSWAWRNGYLPETTTGAGNGNGFKAGGYGGGYVANGVKHTVRLSVAFNNRASGFYANHHTVADDFFSNTSYGNHPDFNMLGVSPSGAAIGIGNLRDNIAYTGTALSNMTGTDAAFNSWNLSVTLSDAQFQSVSTSGWDAPRQADGSLPALPYLHLAANSALIDKGTNVGLPYHGSAPDLGAFETP